MPTMKATTSRIGKEWKNSKWRLKLKIFIYVITSISLLSYTPSYATAMKITIDVIVNYTVSRKHFL